MVYFNSVMSLPKRRVTKMSKMVSVMRDPSIYRCDSLAFAKPDISKTLPPQDRVYQSAFTNISVELLLATHDVCTFAKNGISTGRQENSYIFNSIGNDVDMHVLCTEKYVCDVPHTTEAF